MSEIKIGDTVDCSGWQCGSATCKDGKVWTYTNEDGITGITGEWTDGEPIHGVRPDQITRHVPAAPVVEQPKSVGDKLASEMTVRETFIKAAMQGLFADPACENISEELMINTVDRIIAALDKERA